MYVAIDSVEMMT